MPLVIDVSSEERDWTDLGTEGRRNYYDEDGYVFTGMYDEMGIHFTIGGLFFFYCQFLTDLFKSQGYFHLHILYLYPLL